MQHGIRLTQNLQIPKLKVKIKTSGLIQKCSSNNNTKRMGTKIYHVKLIYIGSTQNGAHMHYNYIYNYSSKEDELERMPILVRYFVATFTAFITW